MKSRLRVFVFLKKLLLRTLPNPCLPVGFFKLTAKIASSLDLVCYLGCSGKKTCRYYFCGSSVVVGLPKMILCKNLTRQTSRSINSNDIETHHRLRRRMRRPPVRER